MNRWRACGKILDHVCGESEYCEKGHDEELYFKLHLERRGRKSVMSEKTYEYELLRYSYCVAS
jgi:hypothetical protein